MLMKVLIDIKDDKKVNGLLTFLKEIPFVKIEKKVKQEKHITLMRYLDYGRIEI
jgi:hypothetical protein